MTDDTKRLANELYTAVIDYHNPTKMSNVIRMAALLRETVLDDESWCKELDETIHDYCLMYADQIDQRRHGIEIRHESLTGRYDDDLYFPCPFDGIVDALEESGWLTEEEES
jgi:hypothetical protein